MQKYAGTSNLVPVCKQIRADLETPVSCYMKAALGKNSFLLESVTGGEHVGRYSYIGLEPYMVMRFENGRTYVEHRLQNTREATTEFSDPLAAISHYLDPLKSVRVPGMPRFAGGAAGYLAYECVSRFESIDAPDVHDLATPEAVLLFCDLVIAFDHVKRDAYIISHIRTDRDIHAEYERAAERIEQVASRLKRPVDERALKEARVGGAVFCNQQPEEFMSKVSRVKEYIAAGDAIQVVISQRFAREAHCHPFKVYRALRSINPSPYMFYFDFGDFQLAGASSEMLVRVEDRVAYTRPLAGTRARGRTAREDDALVRELLADEKERAEHVMLVDLARNDLGRVCKPGSVKVDTLMDVEKYSHVMHIVSGVRGELRDDVSQYSAAKSAFPAGTLSGAPKIRAMQIISELEPTQRGPYGGATGYFDYSGNLDLAITIRTILLKDKMAYVQAGAGIVADSDPKREHDECLRKAEAMLRALDDAAGVESGERG